MLYISCIYILYVLTMNILALYTISTYITVSKHSQHSLTYVQPSYLINFKRIFII